MNNANGISACMLVKDEIHRIDDCLNSVLDVVDEILIMDTGSTDGTSEHLRSQYGLAVQTGQLRRERCYAKNELRNRLYAQARGEWILSIDADERLALDGESLRERITSARNVAGFFGRWINHIVDTPPFEDYKLFLFRRGLRKRGLVHDNVQLDIRERGLQAAWLAELVVNHHPETRKLADKTALYRWRLEQALSLEPIWHRYRWFLGYMDFQAGNWWAARHRWAALIASRSKFFPVEGLNARLVLAEIAAREGQQAETLAILREALAFYMEVASDFEVEINFRLHPWLLRALSDAEVGNLEKIVCYRFAR